MTYVMAHMLLALLGIAGFMLSAYIHHGKREKAPMVCPIGHDCAPVVTSEYSKFLGIPLEVLGMVYYMMIALSYVMLLAFPQLRVQGVDTILFAASSAAFLFSTYLVFVQWFLLKKWCSWCVVSAAISTSIFATVFLAGFNL
jgi:uncharacterized membrane protein